MCDEQGPLHKGTLGVHRVNTTSHLTHGHCKVSLTPFCVKWMKCDKMMEHGRLWSEEETAHCWMPGVRNDSDAAAAWVPLVMRYCTGNWRAVVEDVTWSSQKQSQHVKQTLKECYKDVVGQQRMSRVGVSQASSQQTGTIAKGCRWPGSTSYNSESKEMGWHARQKASPAEAVEKIGTPYHQHCWMTDLETDLTDLQNWLTVLCVISTCMCLYSPGCLEE